MKFFNIMIFLIFCHQEPSLAQTQIECGEGNCDIPGAVQTFYQENMGGHYSFDILNDSPTLNVYIPSDKKPDDIRASIQNKNLFTNNISVNLSSNMTPNSKAGSLMLVSDIVRELNIILNGNNGSRGTDSNYICGQNFLNGIYGHQANSFFIQRRATNQALSYNCDSTDIEWIDNNKFACPTGFSSVPNANITIDRYKGKRTCVALLEEQRCVQRSFNITCEFNAVGDRPCTNGDYELLYSWTEQQSDGQLTPPLYGSVCDPTKQGLPSSEHFHCDDKRCLKKTGRVKVMSTKVFEHEIKTPTGQFKSGHEVCNDIFKKFGAPYVEYTNLAHLSQGEVLAYYPDDKAYSSNKNWIKIPWPDIIQFPAFEEKYGTPFDISNPDHLHMIRVKINKTKSKVGIGACFGLDYTSYFNNTCYRFPGGAKSGALVISFVDPVSGVASNEVSVTFPEGREGTFFGFASVEISGGYKVWQNFSQTQYNTYKDVVVYINNFTGALPWGLSNHPKIWIHNRSPQYNSLLHTGRYKFFPNGQTELSHKAALAIAKHFGISEVYLSRSQNTPDHLYKNIIVKLPSNGNFPERYHPNDIVAPASRAVLPLCYTDVSTNNVYCIMGCKTPIKCEYLKENEHNLYFGTIVETDEGGGKIRDDETGELLTYTKGGVRADFSLSAPFDGDGLIPIYRAEGSPRIVSGPSPHIFGEFIAEPASLLWFSWAKVTKARAGNNAESCFITSYGSSARKNCLDRFAEDVSQYFFHYGTLPSSFPVPTNLNGKHFRSTPWMNAKFQQNGSLVKVQQYY